VVRRLISFLVAAVLLCGFVFLALNPKRLGDGLSSSSPVRCPGGFDGLDIEFGDFFEGDEKPVKPEIRELLDDPNFGASSQAVGDLEEGIVDQRIVEALKAVAAEHEICVDAFKTGHYFIEGVEDTPVIPDDYGDAGGLPNTHYFGRAADIWDVDGKPVEGNGEDVDVLGVGRVLAGLPPQRRPDQIIGPESWTRRLDRSYEEGWILAQDQLDLHDDHIHIGFLRENGTRNVR
jgi:hypothetical protein